ncbi:MAG: hypothetical protein WDN45_19210 [Caulobacteraceae bacterium]
MSWTDGQALVQVRSVNAANAFAWESHRLAYDKAPLSEVVADLNRYVARPIRIADPALGQLAYTGVLDLEGEDVMLRKIGAVLRWRPRRFRPKSCCSGPGPRRSSRRRRRWCNRCSSWAPGPSRVRRHPPKRPPKAPQKLPLPAPPKAPGRVTPP